MLDPSADEIRKWGNSVIQLMTDYLCSLRDRGVYRHMFSRRIRDRLDAALPTKGTDFDGLLRVFREDIIPFSRQNAHPRMFGYVQSPGTPIAAFADLLASTLNANLTVWRSAPAPVEVERLTIDWIRQILGFNAGAGGLFVSGGSMANLAALAAARQTKDCLSGRLRIYASSETHFSIVKAAALLGIGRENVCHIAVDERFRIRMDDLVVKITADLEAGCVPLCVVANAGTVNTGAVDPLAEIREIANRFQLWMHVDGSYGALAILAKSARELFAGIERADSVALDPHKWLYLPVDVGCVIYRDPEIVHAAFAHEAEYTRIIGQEADEAFAFWDYGPELSRRFRALKVWMLLKGVGVDALSEAIENNLACARHLESMVRASDDFEMAAPVELSIFCFRHMPAQLRNESPKTIDAFNERLLVALQRDGSSYLSNATLGGRFALRGCVLNYRTTLHDIEILLDDLRRVAKSLAS
ncbi:MAG: pyridoxal-dependent decarboxylase [Verrucomicrobia bacterium]|nr:MAG: pyridoxal-dependent decarboxylase [Verrucomicrobiota bacterium]PYJ28150.1 MAG: pyridoxal-dependent decarboxylase [Verrucomicrobiota bacterium]PYJ43239.1 MAG: pyridoxal-dependent decarboxylase [Verrucomicrobiota bacterium]